MRTMSRSTNPSGPASLAGHHFVTPTNSAARVASSAPPQAKPMATGLFPVRSRRVRVLGTRLRRRVVRRAATTSAMPVTSIASRGSQGAREEVRHGWR